MKYILTAEASDDIEAIVTWIAGDNPERAVLFGRELLKSCRSLTAMPSAFPVFDANVDPPVRRRNYAKYAIFYRAMTDHVRILAVLHGARGVDVIVTQRLD